MFQVNLNIFKDTEKLPEWTYFDKGVNICTYTDGINILTIEVCDNCYVSRFNNDNNPDEVDVEGCTVKELEEFCINRIAFYIELLGYKKMVNSDGFFTYYVNSVTGEKKLELDDSEVESNYFYETSDGFFTYYVNSVTGEKKFELEEGDILVEREVDDFFRSSIPIFE